MSQRHTDAAVLEAARSCVIVHGVRRTTVADIARRAGASRMTVYRLFPDARTLWSTLLTRQFTEVVQRAEAEVAQLPTARERLVATTAAVVDTVADDPLVRRVLELDPDLLVPYMVDRLGESQRLAIARFHRYLDEGRRDGSIRAVDAGVVTYVLQLVVGAVVMAARVTERESAQPAVTSELRRMLDAYLRPDVPQ